MVHKKYSRRQILLAASACLVVMGILTFYLWHLTENIRLGYAVGRDQSAKQRLEKDIQSLKAEREALSSPERIEKIAREKLGLGDMRDDQIVYEDRK
ncbi:MAG: cell division protein FtsL [Candidatus Aminicenantes bacterium]|nr:cell division protein FtsL [Candidatus Aminicenantes bacterium]